MAKPSTFCIALAGTQQHETRQHDGIMASLYVRRTTPSLYGPLERGRSCLNMHLLHALC